MSVDAAVGDTVPWLERRESECGIDRQGNQPLDTSRLRYFSCDRLEKGGG